MDISYQSQIAITDYLIKQLEIKLAGRDTSECLGQLPHDKYHLGVLAPQIDSGELFTQPTPENVPATSEDFSHSIDALELDTTTLQAEPGNEDADYSPAQVENEDADRLSRESILSRRGAPPALGIEFRVDSDRPFQLEFFVRFAFYTRRFPSWSQLDGLYQTESLSARHSISMPDRHIRHDVEVGPLQILLDTKTGPGPIVEKPFQDEISRILAAERQYLDVWRELPSMTIPLRAIASEAKYQDYLASHQAAIDVPPIAAYLDIRTLKMSDSTVRVSAYLVNGTRADERSVVANTTRYLIDARFSCVGEVSLAPIEVVSLPEDYQYDPNVWAVGQGCSAHVSEEDGTWIINTEALPKYDQPRLTTRNEPKAIFSRLEADPLPLLHEIHEKMKVYAREWKEQLDSGALPFMNSLQQNSCQEDLEKFVAETDRFYEGIQALEFDPRLLTAFQAMHRVFQRVGKPRKIESWRLFQLGFIVTQLPSLAVREGFQSDSLGYADVLWFPTGGGKTEAYLGLIACALLYDRLRGKTHGVAAWLRFPLRMLSVQQLQRAVKVIYETEVERQNLFGDAAQDSAPFGLGYFVGKSSTPNQLTEQSWAGPWKLSSLSSRKDVRDKLRLVRVCPRCGEEAVEIDVDAKAVRIKHICQACKLDLNIFVSDDEVFRYLPAVLVGTVDKLPSVAWRRQFSQIWGHANKRCPEHGFTSGKYCFVWGCKADLIPVTLYDGGPSLQIQDELHLLREELGTFAGHYETLATFCQSWRYKPPKILAATATVEGLDRQSPHLYNLPARRFPTRGYELGKSFYTDYRRDEDEEPMISRRYLAFKPPFLRPPDASSDVLEILHAEVRELYTLLVEHGPAALADRLGIPSFSNDEEALSLLDKYDTSLTYVGSKAHGSRVERELKDRGRSLSKAGNRDIEVRYLNGESSLDEIASTIDALESEDDWDDDERLDAVVGTSLISHGVDVSRFNVMVMAGMPGRTAEYIQSSSRSGRNFVGLIVVALSPWLLREQSMYHRFETYHYHMEHMVEPVPINRFSRFAVDKTLPGILAGILNAYFGPQTDNDLSRTQNVQKLIYEDTLFSEQDVLQAIEIAYSLQSKLYAQSLRLALQERVNQRFKSEMRRLSQPGAQKRVTEALSRKPMTSLRDVDEPVPFDAREYSWAKLNWLR